MKTRSAGAGSAAARSKSEFEAILTNRGSFAPANRREMRQNRASAAVRLGQIPILEQDQPEQQGRRSVQDGITRDHAQVGIEQPRRRRRVADNGGSKIEPGERRQTP